MSVQHTPGPWSYRPREYDDWGFVRAVDGNLVAVAKDSSIPLSEHDAFRARGADPYEANARLIAAAPDLLEALRDVVGHARFVAVNFDIHYAHLDDAFAAIAKATNSPLREGLEQQGGV